MLIPALFGIYCQKHFWDDSLHITENKNQQQKCEEIFFFLIYFFIVQAEVEEAMPKLSFHSHLFL